MSHASLLVAVDVGSRQHEVVIGSPSGKLLDHFQIDHQRDGFSLFFDRIAAHQSQLTGTVSVAMEGYNGWARPLDSMVHEQGWALYNVNNLKLARYKEIFPAPAKTDAIDAKRMLELFAFKDHQHLAGDVLQAVPPPDPVHQQLKYLTRRRRIMVKEKVQRVTRLRVDLQAYAPGLADMTTAVDRQWFLNFITCRDDLRQLKSLQRKTIDGIRGVGSRFAEQIVQWQSHACFSPNIHLASEDIAEDARAIVRLMREIDMLDKRIANLLPQSSSTMHLLTLPGFGNTSVAELMGEIGSIERFKSEASLAYYLGMAPLDHSSGLSQRSKRASNINQQCQNAMTTCVARHTRQVAESKAFYDRKRAAGKPHNQAVRALGRHLCRVIFKMLTEQRDYRNPDKKSEPQG